MSRALTPAELWEELVQEAGEEEVADAAAMTDEEAEAYLVANGFDLGEVRAQAEAALAGIGGHAAFVAAPEEKRAGEERSGLRELGEGKRRRPRTALWLAAAATVAVGSAVAYATLGERRGGEVRPDEPQVPPAPAPTVLPPTEAPEIAEARRLREKAADTLAAGDPDGAQRLLNRAAAEDPEGDKTDAVKALRGRVAAAVGGRRRRRSSGPGPAAVVRPLRPIRARIPV